MCKYSLENVASFKAEEGDKFVVAGDGHGRQFWGTKAPDTNPAGKRLNGLTLACVVGGQKVTLENVQFIGRYPGHRYVPTIGGSYLSDLSMDEYVGKDVVVEVLYHPDLIPLRTKHPELADSVMFPNGCFVLFSDLGNIKGFVGEKPSLEQKLGLDTMSALDPEPKPNDDEKQPDQPDQPDREPAKEPVREAGDD